MSLKIWLPLTNSIKNQGLSNYTITQIGTLNWVDGKLGSKALKIGDGTQVTNGLQLNSNLTDILNGQYSVAVWVKPYGNHVHYNGSIMSSGNWNTVNKRWSFGLSQDNSKVDILSMNYNQWITCSVPANKWTHLCCTRDNNNIVRLYKNGEYIGQLDRSSDPAFDSDYLTTCIGRETYASGYFSFNGALQDLRLYDHCLSVKEIKELSQGLILHYKFDKESCCNNVNLLNNSSTFGTGFNISNGTLLTDKLYGNAIVKGDNTSGSTYKDFCQYSNAVTVNYGDTYTLSYWAKADTAGTSITNYFYRNNSGSTTYVQVSNIRSSTGLNKSGTDGNAPITLTTEWKQYWITYYFGVDGPAAAKIILFRLAAGAGPVYVSNVQLYKNNSICKDSSGYGYNGTSYGAISCGYNSQRHETCIYTPSGNTDYIVTPVLNLPGDAITMSFWWKSSNTSAGSGYHIPFCSWSGSNYEISIPNNGQFRGGFVINGSRQCYNASATLLDGNWHLCAMTYDGATIKRYVDGVSVLDTNYAGTLVTSTDFCIGHYGSNTGYCNKEAYMSDLRLYSTALSPDDIKELYQIPINIDNFNNIHSFDFSEDDKKSINKNGYVHATDISEFQLTNNFLYDRNIYIEPDGSYWIKIFHHNNPGAGAFSSSDTFTQPLYKDANKWFNVSICNYFSNSWELMIKQKETSTSPEYKYRWIQTKNPMTATFGDVDAADITRILTDGYTTGYVDSSNDYGGLYKLDNSNTYLSANNSRSSSWWGATGAKNLYTGGIPAYAGKVVTTGYMDLYIRIPDNILNANILKDGIFIARSFIEK